MARLRKLSNSKVKKEDPTSPIGERLTKARERKGISLEEAHKQTKIHPRVLEALEEDRLENILGQAYVKSFLRNYATYLGLDATGLVREYSQSHAPESSQRPVLGQKPLLQGEKRDFTHVTIVALAFLIWFLILGFAGARFVHYYRAFVKNRHVITARKARLKEKTENRERRDSSKGLIPIPKRNTIALTLITSNDVWLKVMLDGDVVFYKTLPKDSRETWRAKEEIRLTEVGRPEALRLNVNGRDIDLSERRLGKKIIITHEGIDLGSK